MFAHNLILGGVEISFDSAHTLEQTYEPLGGRHLMRLADGSGVLQHAWDGKLRTTIRGNGRLPEGLFNLDYTGSLSLSCMAPVSIWSATTAGPTLPTTRRSDWAPHGYAIVSGRHVATPISIASDVVTFTAVTGATGYVVAYYPTLTVYAEPPRQSFSGRSPGAGWEIIAEEV